MSIVIMVFLSSLITKKNLRLSFFVPLKSRMQHQKIRIIRKARNNKPLDDVIIGSRFA